MDFEQNKLLKIEDPEYFASDAISNSDLSVFKDQGARAFYESKILKIKNVDESSKANFDFGSLCHLLILEPEKVNEKIVLFDGLRPTSENELRFAHFVQKGMTIEEAYIQCYSIKGKTDKAIAVEASNRYDKLCGYINCIEDEKAGKIVVNSETWEKAEQLVRSYQNNPFVIIFKERTDEIYNEYAVFWKESFELTLKAKIDQLIVDHKNKSIYHVDLKTTSKTNSAGFKNSIFSYNYHTQIAHYRAGIISIPYFQDLINSGYSLRSFIVALDKLYLSCRVYQIGDNLIQNGQATRYWTLQKIDSMFKYYKETNYNPLSWNEDLYLEKPEVIDVCEE
jgi:hypothetical protein